MLAGVAEGPGELTRDWKHMVDWRNADAIDRAADDRRAERTRSCSSFCNQRSVDNLCASIGKVGEQPISVEWRVAELGGGGSGDGIMKLSI